MLLPLSKTPMQGVGAAIARCLAHWQNRGIVDTFYYLPYSPWSEKAAWALDHHRSPVRRKVHVVLFGELAMRFKQRKWSGPITVPALVTDGGAMTDSFDIARWADERGSEPTLFPEGADGQIVEWNKKSEALMFAGRVRVTARVLTQPAALQRMVPPPLSKLGPVSLGIGRWGCRHLARKYGFSLDSAPAQLDVMRGILGELRAAVGTRDTVLETFSYADVVMVAATHFLLPNPAYLRMARDARAAWRDPELSEEFEDVLAWRDRVLEAHRRVSTD